MSYIFNNSKFLEALKNINAEEIQLDKILLSNSSKLIIDKTYEKISKKSPRSLYYYGDLNKLLTELFKVIYYTDLTTSDLANIYNKNVRTISKLLKLAGWEMTKEEAQRRATLKRDYTSIFLKSRASKAKAMSGSLIEESIRAYFYTELKSKLKDAEIIVGINSPSFIKQSEADIPIIMFNNNEIFKYVIEINGQYWHKNKNKKNNDINKLRILSENGYDVFSINVYVNDNLKNENFIKKLNNVISLIVNDVRKDG